MSLLSREDVLGFLRADDEIPGAIRWAEYHGLMHAWDEANLTFKVWLEGGRTESGSEQYLLAGKFDDYPVLPPSWRFLDPRTGEDIGRAAYPAAGPFQSGTILHSNAVICAPWNRLAYGDKGGPHGDWAQPAQWRQLAPGHTRAATIPDMLARLRAEAAISVGRLGPLPALNVPEVAR